MTVVINIGRRVPVRWFKRTAATIGGLLSFQTNIWLMITNSFSLAKRKASVSNTGVEIIIKHDREKEDLHYEIEWLKVIVRGSKEQEAEEYQEALQMYSRFKNVFTKKEYPKDAELSKHLKSKIIPGIKVEEAYKKGYGSMSDVSIANKLLEMGIMTHIEFIDDYESRTDISSF